MKATKAKTWQELRTEETRRVEKLLRTKFPQTDAYRFNEASIRVRVIDPRFKGKSHVQRDRMIEPLLNRLPEETLSNIMNLFAMAPGEPDDSIVEYMRNSEFENPDLSDD